MSGELSFAFVTMLQNSFFGNDKGSISMHGVKINGVSFAYPGTDKLILKDINMDVEEGEFVCLLGQSGCGKSTFLRLLAGLEMPTQGEISINGIPVKGAGLDRGVVFQDYGLFPWMTMLYVSRQASPFIWRM